MLYSTDRKDGMLLINDPGLMEDSPGQLNYFLGFRMIEKYVKQHGEDSWKDAYTLPVRKFYKNSGYENILQE